MSYSGERRLLLLTGVLVFVVLGIDPEADRYTWLLENLPALLGLGVLMATDSRFQFSRLAYRLILVHAIILMVGGHWTYAEVPLGDWVRDWLGLARNHYDRLGHFAQGFIPAIITREVLLRTSPLSRGPWLFVIVVSICLALSAFYEFVEWWIALLSGESATAFLGTQGDPWDTQWDMFLCFCGAILALLLLSGSHDRSLREVWRGQEISIPQGPRDRADPTIESGGNAGTGP